MYIFLNISRRKGNQRTKFGQLIEHNKKREKNHAENETIRLVPDLIIVFLETLCEVNSSLISIYFNSSQSGIQ